MTKLSDELSGSAPDLAKQLAGMGRGNDTILAHITPKEAMLLKRRGGSGTINPMTGLLEFDDYSSAGDWAGSAGPDDAWSGYGGDDNWGRGDGGSGGGGGGGRGSWEYTDDIGTRHFYEAPTNPDETFANMTNAFQRDQDFNQGPQQAGFFTDFYYNATNPGKFIDSQVGQFVDNFKNDPWAYMGNIGLGALAAVAPPAAVGLKGFANVNAMSGMLGGPTVGGAMSSVAGAIGAPGAPYQMAQNDPVVAAVQSDPLTNVLANDPLAPTPGLDYGSSLASLLGPLMDQPSQTAPVSTGPTAYNFVRFPG